MIEDKILAWKIRLTGIAYILVDMGDRGRQSRDDGFAGSRYFAPHDAKVRNDIEIFELWGQNAFKKLQKNVREGQSVGGNHTCIQLPYCTTAVHVNPYMY